MNKIKLLKILNPMLGIVFLLQAISAVAMLLGKAPRWLYKLHAINGLIFITIVLVHVTLNWGWIKANFLKKNENINRQN